MDGVRVISSLAVFLFLLIASFSAARQERWAKVTEHNYNYLAILKVDGNAKCSGSIPSQWTVLTYCAAVTDPSKTKAYAGMLDVKDAASGKTGVQERNVKKIVGEETLKQLKICTLTEIWDFKDTVGSVPVSGELGTTCTSLGFGTVGSDQGVARVFTVAFTTAKAECGLTEDDGFLGYVVDKAKATEALTTLDFGGPVVCGSVQRAINQEYKVGASSDKNCNLYIEIAKHRTWIEGEIKKAEAEAAGGNGGTGGTGGTGGNGTASSGYSIHSHLNKYSNWKVLWFLVPTIVTFLQY